MARAANPRTHEKNSWFQRSEFSVKEIFTDKHNWDRSYYVHRQEIRPVERAEVEKMLTELQRTRAGLFRLLLPNLRGVPHHFPGVQQQIMLDVWQTVYRSMGEAVRLSEAMFDVPHRHAVLTLPDRLREVLKEDRGLWKVVMDSAQR